MRDRVELEEEDDGWDDGTGEGDDSSDEVHPCPHCRAIIYADVERCPECGEYLSREDAPRRPPWWIVMGFGAALIIVARWIVGFP